MEEGRVLVVFNLLANLTPVTNKLDSVEFGSFYCMLLEEWCKYNDQDIVLFIQTFAEMIKDVNRRDGKY